MMGVAGVNLREESRMVRMIIGAGDRLEDVAALQQ
jgi:hypothetical protein